TLLAAKICNFTSQMLEGKLVLVGDDEKPLKPSHDAPNIATVGGTSNDGHVEVVNLSLGGNRGATYEMNVTRVTSSYATKG
ncbi:hypothetical protein Tco_1305125, partial [Tanacetum coccineum]